ncbi:MAG: ADP-ribose pyrophosphatase [Hyphomicrobiales bacterium]|nr:MAG: ADP-ribose pyrophosphatase [Hyphomicrobiales bacterium]
MEDFGVFIGRFQPFHKGHLSVVTNALKTMDYVVLVLGSHNKSMNTREPLNYNERIQIIQKSLSPEQRSKVIFTTVEDHLYNLDKWLTEVQKNVNGAIRTITSATYNVYLTGMNKDSSSFYLFKFPKWKSIECPPYEDKYSGLVSASNIREGSYIDGGAYNKRFMCGVEAFELYTKIMKGKATILLPEYKHEQDYSSIWGNGPHHTVDSIVVQAGHILLVRRGGDYGTGTWALPGGFMNKNETMVDGAIRELVEETCLKVPSKVLKGSMCKTNTYDEPSRSNRGIIITNAFYFRLNDTGPLPKVKGADDADKAVWIPLSKLRMLRINMFEDHYDIIEDMIKL